MIKKIILTSSLISFLSACGGGGSAISTEPVSISVRSIETVVTEETPYSFSPTLLSGSGDITYSIENKPSWLDFDQSTGVLSGTPDDADVGIHSGIVVTASNDASSSSYGPFSITVNGINDAPEIADQTITLDDFNLLNSFSLTLNDNDHESSQLELIVIESPTNGSLKLDPLDASKVMYEPKLLNAKDGDSFRIKLSDGDLESDEANIQIQFTDTTPASINTLPGDGSLNVSTSANLVLSSNDPVNIDSLTYNAATGVCTGTLQVSLDGFSNCLGINNVDVQKLATLLTISFTETFQENTEYQVRLSTDIKSVFNASYTANETKFRTANGLIITEVSECYYINTNCWFEIYNPTSSVIDLSSYQLESTFLNQSSQINFSETKEFAFPQKDVNPGQYIVMRSDHTGTAVSSHGRIVFLHDSGTFPFWTNNGYIHLMEGEVSKDVVDFNDFITGASDQWIGFDAESPRSQEEKFGSSIGRDGRNSDTNSAADWRRYDTATLGGVNDVQCTDDLDQDGIPDCSEQPGSTFAGLPLYEWGARAGQKDIFIEIDYMDATDRGEQVADAGIVPRKEALQKVKDVFSERGISVHFDVGDLYDQSIGLNPAEFDLGGGQEVPFQNQLDFVNKPSIYDYKLSYFDYARAQIFHYTVFSNTIQSGSTIAGQAEILGNDIIISLGELDLNTDTPEQINKLINHQAVTLMHELGHNLGLRHGGFEDTNNKANYVSVMNYLYGFNGLPEIGNNEGDRFYDFYFPGDENCAGPLTNSFESDNFILDFSDGEANNLNTFSLSETLGLGLINSTGVDYNCDGDTDDIQVSLAHQFQEVIGVWKDHDDWSNLQLGFSKYSSGSTELTVRTAEQVDIMPDKVGNDRSPIAKEYGFDPTSQANHGDHGAH